MSLDDTGIRFVVYLPRPIPTQNFHSFSATTDWREKYNEVWVFQIGTLDTGVDALTTGP
jgi:hypothetical protein